MDSRAPAECTCGSQNFERVIVSRPSGVVYVTDFLACAECRIMYFSPEPPAVALPRWNDAMPPGYWERDLSKKP